MEGDSGVSVSGCKRDDSGIGSDAAGADSSSFRCERADFDNLMVPDDDKIAIAVVATVASASRVGKGAFSATRAARTSLVVLASAFATD